MLSVIFGLFVLTVVLGFAFKITGALLGAVVWVFIKLPLALVACIVGFILCCTIILMPMGIGIMKAGAKVLVPC